MIFLKDPHATLDYSIDWSRWLESDTINTSSWIVPTGLTQTAASASPQVATIWLSGGVTGTTYTVINRITTNGGRTDDRSITVKVEDR